MCLCVCECSAHQLTDKRIMSPEVEPERLCCLAACPACFTLHLPACLSGVSARRPRHERPTDDDTTSTDDDAHRQGRERERPKCARRMWITWVICNISSNPVCIRRFLDGASTTPVFRDGNWSTPTKTHNTGGC